MQTEISAVSLPNSYSCMVVGLGKIGMGYDLSVESDKYIYSHARAFSSHPKFNLVCGVDPSNDCRDDFFGKYGAPSYSRLEEALSAHSADIVVIAVPTKDHVSTIRKVLELSNPRAILCEKPMGASEYEAKALVDLCATKNTALYVNYVRRCAPGVIKVKQQFCDGAIKAPLRGIVWYSKGFIHNGSHFFNLAEYWLGDSSKAQIIDRGRDAYNGEPEVKVSFPAGDIIFIPAQEEHFSHNTIELLSPSGRLHLDQDELTWQGIVKDPIVTTNKILQKCEEKISIGLHRYQHHVLDQLSQALAGNAASICTGEQALTTISTMNKILELRDK